MITELLNLNLVKELGLDSLPADKKQSLIQQMQDVLENRINIEIISNLTDSDKKDLDKVLESNGDLLAFYRDRIANFDVMVAETVATFKGEMLDMHKLVTDAK